MYNKIKKLPPELSDWFFPFNWDVSEVWTLEGEIEQRNIEDLKWHLEKPFWSSVKGQGMLFDLKPKDVLTEPEKYFNHRMRIKNANLHYPICITTYKGKEIIIDGMHRLAKLVDQKISTIEVKVVDEIAFINIAKFK